MSKKSAKDLVEALQRHESPYESSSSHYSETSYGKPPPLYPELQEVASDFDSSPAIERKVGKGILTLAICGSLLYMGYYFYQSYCHKISNEKKNKLLKIDQNLSKVENNFTVLEEKLETIEKKVTALVRRKQNEKYTKDYIENVDESVNGSNVSSYYHFDSQGRKFKSKWDTFDADAECAKVDLQTADSTQSKVEEDYMKDKADLRNQIAYIMNITEKQQTYLDSLHLESIVKDDVGESIKSRTENMNGGQQVLKEPNHEESMAIQIENVKFRRKQCATRSNNLLDRIDKIATFFNQEDCP